MMTCVCVRVVFPLSESLLQIHVIVTNAITPH